MPYPPEHKPRTHARIVEVASRMFREDGMQATGIDRLMAEAGLTRGGFYAHFPSKAALFAEALRHAFAESRENLLKKGLDRLSGRDWVLGATRRYLAKDHEDTPGLGCAIPTLGAEVARAPTEVREAFGEEVDKVLDGLAARSGADKDEVMALLATWVGAITLARALPDERQADAVLEAARAHIAKTFARPEQAAAER